MKRSYRFEQGFTFELNLSGVADEHRDAFVAKRETDTSDVSDKRMTEDDVVAELRDGMTIGIGGWGSRRKPMSLVRAIARVVARRTSRSCPTAGPTSGCSARPAR